MPSDRCVDRSEIVLKIPLNYCVIYSLYPVMLYFLAQKQMRGVIFRNDQKSARILIYPVNYPGSYNSAYSRKSLPAMIKQRIYKRSRRIPDRGMHNHPLRLIYNDYIVILINYIYRNILGKSLAGLGLRKP